MMPSSSPALPGRAAALTRTPATVGTGSSPCAFSTVDTVDRHPRAARFVVGLVALVALVGLVVPASGCGEARWSVAVGPLPPSILLSVWGTSGSDVWAVGGACPGLLQGMPCTDASTPKVMHYDGNAWTERAAPGMNLLWWVHAFAPDNVWMVGEGGTVLHWDGAAFTIVPSGAPAGVALFGIWGSRPDDLYAVGGSARGQWAVLHWDGTAFSPAAGAPAPSAKVCGRAAGNKWFKVWGSGPSDVWIVGDNASIGHFDGAAWSLVDVASVVAPTCDGNPTPPDWKTVAGAGAKSVYVVGGTPSRGVAIHYDGAAWSKVAGLDLGKTSQLMGVHETDGGDVAITGFYGAKFVGRLGSFRDWTAAAPSADLHAAWMISGDEVFAVGGNFSLLTKGVLARFGK